MSGSIPNQFKSSKQNKEDEQMSSGSSSARTYTRNGTAAGVGPSSSAGDFVDECQVAVAESASRTNLMSRSNTGLGENYTCVQVALRIRPLLPREVIAKARECISVTPNEPQVKIAGTSTHEFTYDYVFDKDARQDDIFKTVAKPLVDGILEGYNATILAYGQTGSGKTLTMGTGFDPNNATQGLAPRCISYLYTQIQQKTIHTTPPPEFKISVTFTELYNEEIIDLLRDAPQPSSSRQASARSTGVKIHKQANGQIYLVNIKRKQVNSSEQTLETLKTGALNRATASTNMNDQSSRSHAIFTIHVTQNRVIRDKSGATDIETLSGKFHFVDLSGSEELKPTMATGDIAREGIAGLLALGNVISALGDKSKKSSHVPYRDSKLTRLLQDSLGGNSRTLMIACVSPNELDFGETLNTMNYANRAKNIKNRVVLNQEKCSRTMSLLKDEITRLQAELMEYKRGKRPADVNAENIMVLAEVDKLKSKQDTIDKLTSQVARLQALSITSEEDRAGECDLTNMLSRYSTEIEDLRATLYESEAGTLQSPPSENSPMVTANIESTPNATETPGIPSVEKKPTWEEDVAACDPDQIKLLFYIVATAAKDIRANQNQTLETCKECYGCRSGEDCILTEFYKMFREVITKGGDQQRD